MLEAICFQTCDVLCAMKADSNIDNLQLLLVDGGASQNDLLMQMQADLLQVPVRRPANLETTSLGAAFAAGGIGEVVFWCAACIRISVVGTYGVFTLSMASMGRRHITHSMSTHQITHGLQALRLGFGRKRRCSNLMVSTLGAPRFNLPSLRRKLIRGMPSGAKR